ncbi:MAG TPA: energy transducer TonB [Edaphobacter sp.]|nr:energy transducer TonB [Edaphobacter sp.]
MRNDMPFEILLDSVLHEQANPGPSEGLTQRIVDLSRTGAVSAAMDGAVDGLVLTEKLAVEGTLASLWNGVRDLLFPKKLPPLTLASTPIPVADRMAVEREYASTVYAVAAHAMAIFLIGFVVRAQIRKMDEVQRPVRVVQPVLQIMARAAGHNGGGGGQPGEAPVSKGRLPKLADQQIVPPSKPPLLPPRIAIAPTVVMQAMTLADNVMPNVGMPNSPVTGVSIGDGKGTGIGPGNGPGVGPGTGGNTGDGLRRVGGSVSMPEVIYSVEPEFSEEARKAKISGDVTVYLWVDERGNPTHIRVLRGMGMGLDEKAVEAVKQYRFKPAMENGRPVKVEMYVVVNFQIL